MMLSLNKRALLGGAVGLGLQSLAAPSLALQTVRPRASTGAGYRLPTDRFAPRTTLAFWRSHGPDAVLGGGPDDYAPGVISERPNLHVHQPNIYARITQAEIDALRRPADAAYQALIAQPSLSDIRGASLIGDINIRVTPTPPNERLLTASLTLRAKPIRLNSRHTRETNGRFETHEGEGDVLEVMLNPYEYVDSRGLQSMSMVDRIQFLHAGAQMTFIVTDQPASAAWSIAGALEAYADDHSWYSDRPGIHPMAVTVKGMRQTGDELLAGRLPATAPMARLSAAMFMVDWGRLHAAMARGEA